MSNAGLGRAYVATGEVTTLEHELRNHAMELGTSISKSLFAGAKSTEILGSLGDNIIIEIEVDAAALFCPVVSTGPLKEDN